MPGTCEPTAQRPPPLSAGGRCLRARAGLPQGRGSGAGEGEGGGSGCTRAPGELRPPPRAPRTPGSASPRPARGRWRRAGSRGPARAEHRSRRPRRKAGPPPLPPGGRARRAPQTAAPREQPGEPPSCLPASGRRRDDNQGLAPKRGSVRRLCFLTFFGGGEEGGTLPPLTDHPQLLGSFTQTPTSLGGKQSKLPRRSDGALAGT